MKLMQNTNLNLILEKITFKVTLLILNKRKHKMNEFRKLRKVNN